MAVIHPVCPECKMHHPITIRVVNGKLVRKCWECWSKVDGKPHPMLAAMEGRLKNEIRK